MIKKEHGICHTPEAFRAALIKFGGLEGFHYWRDICPVYTNI